MSTSTPWAILLCKYKDTTDEPFPLGLFHKLYTIMGIADRNMVDYFFEISHGNLDLSGSCIFPRPPIYDWFTLETSLSDLETISGDPRSFLVGRARDAAANAGIDLSPFYGTVVFMNIAGGEGGSHNSIYGPWVFLSGNEKFPALIGHEMGHAYGLQHSMEDGNSRSYADPWDIMSAWSTYYAPHIEFGSIGPILNASNMRFMGWLDESRVFMVPPTGYFAANMRPIPEQPPPPPPPPEEPPVPPYSWTVKLRPLVRRDLSGPLVVQLPGGYLVEFRVKEGWDAGIPRSAILIHRFSSADNRSYIMHSTTGSRDLVEGDQFISYTDSIGYSLRVTEIDPAAQVATLSIDRFIVPEVPGPIIFPVDELLRRIKAIQYEFDGLQEALSTAEADNKPKITEQVGYLENVLKRLKSQAVARG